MYLRLFRSADAAPALKTDSLQKTGRNLLEESVESSHAMTRHSTGERLQLLPGLCEGNVRRKDHSADTQGLGLEKSLDASTQS